MHVRLLACVGLCLLGCFGTAPPPAVTVTSDAYKGIAEGNRLLSAAVQVGDADRIATLFTDDATLLDLYLPGTIQGHVAIADYWRKRLAHTRFLEAELITTEVTVSGDLASEVGTSRVKTQVGDGPPSVSTGRYLAVWRLVGGGRWHVQADCFIPDPPQAR